MRDRRGDLGGRPEPPERGLSGLRLGIVAVRGVHVGVGRAGVDDVGGDAARAESRASPRASPPSAALLIAYRAMPGTGTRSAKQEPIAITPAAVLHPPRRRLRGDEHAAHVQRERVVELLQRHVLDRAVRVDACAGDQDVEPAELLRGALDGRRRRAGVGAVGPHRQRAPATRPHRPVTRAAASSCRT